MLHDKSNMEILEELDSYVFGHLDAKKALINLVNRSKIRHYQRWVQQIHKDFVIKPHKCLLVGQSGTGKTHLINSLQEILDFPLVKLDATTLSPAGAKGVTQEDVIDIIKKKAVSCVMNGSGRYHSIEGTLDQMVVFIDEVDKLGISHDSSGNWNTFVQSSFLTLMDNKDEYSGLSFILSGAFSHMTKETKNNFGFTSNAEIAKDNIDADLVKSGLIPELVGRMTQIVQLDKFTEDDYYRVLNEKLIPKKRVDLSYFNLGDFDISEETMRGMCKEAVESGQGIRALDRALDRQFTDLEFDYEQHRYAGLLEDL